MKFIKWLLGDKSMSENNSIKNVWITDGDKDLLIDQTKVEQYINDNPMFKRGRSVLSKKKNNQTPTPAPFDYEQDLVERGELPSWVEVNTIQTIVNPATVTDDNTTHLPNNRSLKLYLVEGTVQMRTLIPGQGTAQSDQRRIVWAYDSNEALEKFKLYFAQLSNPSQLYTVLVAGCSEEIR